MSYMAPEVVVVGRQYTAPYQVDLTIVRKMMTISEGNFGVTDANGNIMFKVKGKALSLRARRVLLDANGNPIVSFQKKIMSMHSTWKVYRGDSNDSKDLVFTVQRSSLFQFKTQLDVFLASNTSKDNRDFKIKGSWFEKSCTIYAGTSSTVIAQYMAPEVVVVGKQYTAPYQVDLMIVHKLMTMSEGNFGVTDANGNIMFKVKGKAWSLRTRRVLLDAAGNPIVSFQKKIMSMHSTWKVYRGDSNDSRDLVFTVQRSSLFQIKTQLDVFLASNISKDKRDFKIKGSWSENSCTISAGKSSTVIAQMHKKDSFSSTLLGKDKFAVTVYPHVDYAFIVALVVILEEINEEYKNNVSSS